MAAMREAMMSSGVETWQWSANEEGLRAISADTRMGLRLDGRGRTDQIVAVTNSHWRTLYTSVRRMLRQTVQSTAATATHSTVPTRSHELCEKCRNDTTRSKMRHRCPRAQAQWPSRGSILHKRSTHGVESPSFLYGSLSLLSFILARIHMTHALMLLAKLAALMLNAPQNPGRTAPGR
jgi:hypothetical protein